MSWRVAIRHRTGYLYGGEVSSSYNEARVTPLTIPRQLVVEAEVRVEPAAPTFRYWDYWGTMVHAFDVHVRHPELCVTGSSVVDTSPAGPFDHLSWPELRGAKAQDRLAELLAPTTYVPRVEELSDQARSMAATGSPVEACEAAGDWVRSRLRYQKDITDVSTTAAEALGMESGVCQDFAHLTLTLLRAMDIPARYTSGYVFPSPETEVGEDVAGQSHAWVEAWVGDWYAFDPTHGVPVGERHVVVARGRDYADVPPLKGIYRGAPAEALRVSVELTRLA